MSIDISLQDLSNEYYFSFRTIDGSRTGLLSAASWEAMMRIGYDIKSNYLNFNSILAHDHCRLKMV